MNLFRALESRAEEFNNDGSFEFRKNFSFFFPTDFDWYTPNDLNIGKSTYQKISAALKEKYVSLASR